MRANIIRMKYYIKQIWMFLRIPLAIPAMICYFFKKESRKIIKKDMERWKKIHHQTSTNDVYLFLYYMLNGDKCLRNIIYRRIGYISHLFKFLLPENKTVHISTEKIGPGFYIQHGDCCYIAAHEIGDNCWVNQGVTLGYSNETDAPFIGNNVTVYAGAKVIGKVIVGNNVKIGANAVVIKDVPDNCTAVGIPATIIRKNI